MMPKHVHLTHWRVEDAEVAVALIEDFYFFKATVRCSCGVIETFTWPYGLLAWKICLDGFNDPSYKKKADEILEEMARDVDASLI